MFAAAEPADEPRTVEDRLMEYGDAVRARLSPQFRSAGLPYPPNAVTLIALKDERRLELHAAAADGEFHFVCAYPILAASGSPGPKLREGDRQVPEGIYAAASLNPNSQFHLALRVGYPNDFDCARAVEDQRTTLGGDIMIHGDAVSRGCLAMGDPAAEDLFVLAALTGVQNVQIIIAPTDFRLKEFAAPPDGAPLWTGDLYAQIKAELTRYTREKP